MYNKYKSDELNVISVGKNNGDNLCNLNEYGSINGGCSLFH